MRLLFLIFCLGPMNAFANVQSQLLWVQASNKPVSVAQMFSLEKGKWNKVGEEFPVVVGRNGTTKDKYEGDGKTPEGKYSLSRMFGVKPRTDLKVKYVQVQPEDKWIDDPQHADYNKWIRGNTTAKSYETLLRKDQQYDLFAVVEYNTEKIVPGRGSAIFVHVWLEPTRGTAGCVAMDPAQMVKLGQWLDPIKKPMIQIGGKPPAI